MPFTLKSIMTYHQNKISGTTYWKGKNGMRYNTSAIRNNGGYMRSMNLAQNTIKIAKSIGFSLGVLSISTSATSALLAVYNGTENTSTWLNFGIGVGTVALTYCCGPIAAAGLVITGGIWSTAQLIWGNKFIDDNIGYR